MSLTIKLRPEISLATVQQQLDQLRERGGEVSAESMDQLVRGALALRHAAHLQRCFTPWIASLDPRERPVIDALLRSLVIELVAEADARIDDHGGYRGEVHHELVGPARAIGLQHFYGYDNAEMSTWSNVELEDRSPPLAKKKGAKAASARLESERVTIAAPTNLEPAAEALFRFLGAQEAVSSATKVRFLLRLLFPWGRYLHGYEGATLEFYANADRLYVLSKARRASAVRAQEDDGEIIPFLIG